MWSWKKRRWVHFVFEENLKNCVHKVIYIFIYVPEVIIYKLITINILTLLSGVVGFFINTVWSNYWIIKSDFQKEAEKCFTVNR